MWAERCAVGTSLEGRSRLDTGLEAGVLTWGCVTYHDSSEGALGKPGSLYQCD